MFDYSCTVNAVLNLFKQYKKFTFVECLASVKKLKLGHIFSIAKITFMTVDISFYEVFISF